MPHWLPDCLWVLFWGGGATGCIALVITAFRARRRLWRAPGILAAALAPLMMGATFGGMPIAPNNTMMAFYPSWQHVAILRLGYATPGDGPAVWYNPSSTACTLNSGNGDGGSQVKLKDGGCANLAPQPAGYDVRIWGPPTSGDASTVIQTALNDSPGPLLFPPPAVAQFTISSNLSVPATANIVCGPAIPGYPPSYNFTGQANLFLSSSATITFGATDGGSSGIQGCNIVRSGFTNPTDLRSMITQVAAFAGTAITCSNSNGSDITIERNIFIGFAQAISSACQRVHIVQDYGDDTAGLLITECLDICEIHDDEFFPFLAAPQSGLSHSETMTVSGAVSNSGSIELTYTPGATALITGDTVVVSSVGGVVTGARCVVTVNDSTHITLTPNGTVCPSFSGSYTSGGTVFLNADYRTGAAFTVTNSGSTSGGPKMSRLSEYGFDTGVHFGGLASFVECKQCWLDNYTGSDNYDPVPRGLVMDSTFGDDIFSGYILEPSNIVDMSASGGRLYISPGTRLGAVGWDFGAHSIAVTAGSLYISSADVDALGTANEGLYIADGATVVARSAGLFNAGVTYQTTSTDCPKYFVEGQSNCAYTPTLQASGGGAVAGYTTQIGNYTTSLDGAWTVNADVIITGVGTLSGNLQSVIPTRQSPAGSASDLAVCTVNRISGGVTMATGRTWIAGQVAGGNSNQVVFTELPNSIGLDVSTISAGSFEVAFGCVGHNP